MKIEWIWLNLMWKCLNLIWKWLVEFWIYWYFWNSDIWWEKKKMISPIWNENIWSMNCINIPYWAVSSFPIVENFSGTLSSGEECSKPSIKYDLNLYNFITLYLFNIHKMIHDIWLFLTTWGSCQDIFIVKINQYLIWLVKQNKTQKIICWLFEIFHPLFHKNP